MKKPLLLLLIFTASAFSCFAQQKLPTSFSVGLNAGILVGPATNLYNYASGVTAKYEFASITKLKLTLTSGLDIFAVKDALNDAKKDTFLPLEVGGKYYMHRFYLEGAVGASINTNSNYVGQGTGFVYAPGIGYSIPALDMQEVDFSIRYEGRVVSQSSINQIALRIAYKFDY
jgi:hypothetical protein